MENQRRYYANKLDEEIRQLEVYRQRSEDTITRLKSSDSSNVSAIRQKISSLKDSITKYEQDIESKTQEAREVRAGTRDSELKQQAQTRKKSQKQRRKEAEQKRAETREESRAQKEISERYYQNTRDASRSHRRSEWDMKREYKWFVKTCSYIPDYLQRKLDNMPNNRGYIWRGIWLMGGRDSEPGQPVVMQERKNKDHLLIHEIDACEHRIYEKRGSDKRTRRVLVSTTPRKQRRGALSTEFFK
jgi:myosin heavy subunit